MSSRVVNPKTGAIPKQPPRAGTAAVARAGAAAASRAGAAPASRPGSAKPRPGSAGATAKKNLPSKPPTCPAAAAKLKKAKKEEPAGPPPPKAYENPAFSIPLKRVQTNPLLADKEKKKAIRRNIPPGEDIKEMKKILTSLKNKPEITVGEFLSLIAPSTGDNGEVLREVLIEDMNSFRNLARRIYNTMTQDVSDVLTNQHIQLKEYEQEKTILYTEKMMRAINEIYSYAPKFDFEAYYANSQEYLASLFPIPKLIEADSEEAEMHRRQQAFHRLNWLRTEGERLAAENTRLQSRLNELKKEQKQELIAAEARAEEAEVKRQELESEETEMQHKLDNLTDKVQKTMIDTEASMRIVTDEGNILAPPKKTASKTAGPRRRPKKPEWASETAAEIEEKAIEENIIAEGAQSEAEAETLAGAIKKVRSKTSKTMFKRSEPTTPEQRGKARKPASPFHFSPIKTPPSKPPPPKERSPFHFSPIKTPPPRVQSQAPPSPFHFSPPKSPPRAEPVQKPPSPPPQLHTTRLRTERVTVQERQPRGLFPPSQDMDVTPTTGLSAPSGYGPEDVTPYDRPIPEVQPVAPARQGVAKLSPTRRGPVPPKPEFQQAPPPGPVRRGREYAPRDSWGGFY
ncbi:hypothetical protein HHI36_014536 [Cryptolaemus montrouzieri]|uniref:Uncharacterized protein n=1 Tax=Cryptolaemus montrouzieri TaxID=559131 RepID=A0ABD2N2V0_9CUCU